MKLQIALDTVRTDKALILVDKIYDIIDIVEIGTPMMLQFQKSLDAKKGTKEREFLP